MAQPLRILFVTSEVTPFARTGGLGDVCGALPKALAAFGHDVRVVMPLYQAVRLGAFPLTRVVSDLQVTLAAGTHMAQVWQSTLPRASGSLPSQADVPIYFVEQDDYFARPEIYGTSAGDYPDNAARFAFFNVATLALVTRLGWFPHIWHCHDWQSGLIPAYLRVGTDLDHRLAAATTIYTVHNLAYQGRFPPETFPYLGLPPQCFQPDGLEFYGDVSFMKAGLFYADHLTTVSPTYADEICTPEGGYGLDGLLRHRHAALVGILNGVDYEVWNPATDTHLVARYSATDLHGKAACKTALLRTYGLPEEPATPLVGIICRLIDQKGVDLLTAALPRLLIMHLHLVLLGSGETRYEEFWRAAARAHPQRVGVRLGFDDPLAHQIEAGSDLFLMPSRFEPCGLSQLYSLRYGTIPLVRATGGLRDTVTPCDATTGQGTGFAFDEPSPDALLATLWSALEVYITRPTVWRQVIQNAMAQDFSWQRSAAQYLALYQQTLATRHGAPTAAMP